MRPALSPVSSLAGGGGPMACLGDNFEEYKQTTKTGAIAAHDLKLCPLVMRVIGMKGVWNMDARASGISANDDADADQDDIMAQAAHSQVSTMARYVRGTIGTLRKVANLRAAHRADRKPND